MLGIGMVLIVIVIDMQAGLPIVRSSPVRSTVSTPLRVLNEITLDGFFNDEYSTAADAMVACPQRGTSRVGVNQRRPKTDPEAWSPAPGVAVLSSCMNAVSDIFISIATSSISLSVSACAAVVVLMLIFPSHKRSHLPVRHQHHSSRVAGEWACCERICLEQAECARHLRESGDE